LRVYVDVGAEATGHWSGCHAVGWDRNAPPYGDLAVGDGFQKHSYPFGVMVNAEGKRFLDEGFSLTCCCLGNLLWLSRCNDEGLLF
jgi:tricarballylate dehydrogenase